MDTKWFITWTRHTKETKVELRLGGVPALVAVFAATYWGILNVLITFAEFGRLEILGSAAGLGLMFTFLSWLSLQQVGEFKALDKVDQPAGNP